MARALSLTLGTDVCTVTAFPDPRVGGACVLRALRRFFGFDAGEEEDPGIAMTLASGPQSGAFRVGEKLSIKGEIVGEGDLELAGRFEGIINVNGRVLVGDRAVVDADISASNIVVGGKVRGNLNATGRVEILPQGILTGNLKTGSFAAADGALVKGEIVVDRGSRGRIEVGGQP
jgi:cytoskeletal protein CcmA (bactofilin family)